MTNVLAQSQTATSTTQSQTPAPQTEDDYVFKSRKRRVSKPAEFQGAGVLQLDYGYSGDFRARDASAAQSLTVNLNFAVTDHLLLEFSQDNVASQTDRFSFRQSGIGNTYLGFQWTALEEKKDRPSLAFAYLATLPTASESKGLSNGRAWHKVTTLVSKEVRETDIDINASLLLNGIQTQRGYDKGAQLAIGFTRNFNRGIGFQWELSGQTIDADEPKGVFALWALTWQPNVRLQFDLGMRYGLTPAAPRYGIFVGINFAAANLYPSRRK